MPYFCVMKKLLIPVSALACVWLFYEQYQEKPNLYITVVCLAFFLFGLMGLSQRIPGKADKKSDEDVQ